MSRQSAWMEVSSAELQLLLRLRSLEAGEHQVVVVKVERGGRGLSGWRVSEGRAAEGRPMEHPSQQKAPDGAFRVSDAFSQRDQ